MSATKDAVVDQLNKKDDGGQAFPPNGTHPFVFHEGMTLRDWFAGQAIMGLLACPGTSGEVPMFSQAAYKHADAMLAERAKGGTP